MSGFIVVLFYLAATSYAALSCAIYFTDVLSGVLLILGGLFTSVVLSALIHELFHALFGKLNGFKVADMTICGVKADFISKRLKLVSPTDFGQTSLIPEVGNNYTGRYIRATLAGIISGGVIAAALCAVHFSVANSGVKLFTSFWGFSAVMFLINAIPLLIPTSDGSSVYFARKYKKTYEKQFEITARYYGGEIFSEMDGELFEDVPTKAPDRLRRTALLFALMRAEEIGDGKVVKEMADGLLSPLDEDEAAEMVYAYSTIGDGDGLKRIEQTALPMIDRLSGANGARALLSRAEFYGDERYFSVAYPTLNRLVEKCVFYGERRREKLLSEKLFIK
ncbi:MAG: hypothetical protein J6N93_05510 [Clostridia bacterium]|nr:hypothetical protein [Clostridia bacterium]